MDIKFLLPLLVLIIPFSLSFFFFLLLRVLTSFIKSFFFSVFFIFSHLRRWICFILFFMAASFYPLLVSRAILCLCYLFSQMLRFSAIPFSQRISNFSIFRFYRSLPSLKAISYYYSSEPRNGATENTENLFNSFLFFSILQQRTVS